MKRYGISNLKPWTYIIFCLLLLSCKGEKQKTIAPRDYPEIIESGVLHAVTEYNSISYHAQYDTVVGLHYELLQTFAKEKGLKVELTPEMSLMDRSEGMQDGTYDLLANNVLISSERNDSLLYTHPFLLSKQVLVQRKPQSENDSTFIHNQLELSNKTLHMIKGSPSIHRIRNLSNEIGDTIFIQEVDKYGMEQLLIMVSYGEIDYAVCDESIAMASLDELPNLDIDTKISFTQFYAWGVNKNSPILLDSLNVWIDRYKETPEFQKLVKKYIHAIN